jgi:hypothetical protein
MVKTSQLGASTELRAGLEELQNDGFAPISNSPQDWEDIPKMAHTGLFQNKGFSGEQLLSIISSILPKQYVILVSFQFWIVKD